MKRVTQADIAKSLGISPTTVGLVVGSTDSELRARLSKETVRRIEAKALELGYRPNRGAQILRCGRSNLIVLLNFGGYSELASKRAFQVGRLVHEAGYDFQTVDAYWWIGDASRVVDQLQGLHPEGILVTGSLQVPFESRHIESLVAAGIPVVSIGIEIQGIPWVHYDAKGAIRELTRNMIRLGRKRLALFVGSASDGELTWQTRDRAQGFREILEEEGYPQPEWRGDMRCNFTKDATFQSVILCDNRKRSLFDGGSEQVLSAAGEILKNPLMPDAIICSNDTYAMGVISVCVRRGIAVPQEIAVTGFDNLASGMLSGVIPTTVEQPTEALCEKAMDLLMTRIGKPARAEKNAEKHAIPCAIHWRESTPAAGLSPAPFPCLSE